MAERPIIFSGPMVRAILDGTKTQTRRVVKPQPRDGAVSPVCENGWWMWQRLNAERRHYDGKIVDKVNDRRCPYGVPGDRLWVREAWAQRLDRDHLNGTQLYESGVREAWYWADGPGKCCRTGCAGAAGRVRASRFMPRWASRITLDLTDVRVERLQDISANDCYEEGCERPSRTAIGSEVCRIQNARNEYARLWDSINGKGAWDRNDWVWALTFRKVP